MFICEDNAWGGVHSVGCMGVCDLKYPELLPVKRGDSWRFGNRIAIRVSGYSAPLLRLATGHVYIIPDVETWSLKSPVGSQQERLAVATDRAPWAGQCDCTSYVSMILGHVAAGVPDLSGSRCVTVVRVLQPCHQA
jgi:hypothetical protein